MTFAAPEGTELVEHLGSGTVFDVALVRREGDIAICKRLTSRLVRERVGSEAMQREVGLLERAQHRALPALLAFGSDAHGPFVVETRMPGVSLSEFGTAWRRDRGPLPEKLVGHVALRAADALAAFHALRADGSELSAVHGDIAPDHVFFGPDEDVGFVDFGAARFRGMARGENGDRGTLPFVAPEIARSEIEPDAAGDVYALASTLLAFATGEPLTRSTEEAAMLMEVGERGLSLDAIECADAIDAATRAGLMAALAFDRDARLTTARELAAAFRKG